MITLGWGLCPFGGRDTQRRARGARTGNGMWGMRGKPREPRVMRREGGLEEQSKGRYGQQAIFANFGHSGHGLNVTEFAILSLHVPVEWLDSVHYQRYGQ